MSGYNNAIELPIFESFPFISGNSREELLRFAELNLNYSYSTSFMWLIAASANFTDL